VFVGDVVGELELMKRHGSAHPLITGQRGVRVDVHSLRHLGVRLTGHDPARVVELVPALVHWNNVHHEDVLAASLQPANLHLERREHSPRIVNHRHFYRHHNDVDWGGGSFARSHNPTAVYMTFFPNGVMRKFFPSFGDTLSTHTSN